MEDLFLPHLSNVPLMKRLDSDGFVKRGIARRRGRLSFGGHLTNATMLEWKRVTKMCADDMWGVTAG
jgi:hypothetical protein